MPREKVTIQERIDVAKACFDGKISTSEAARGLGVDSSTVRSWVKRYTYGGSLAFKQQEKNNVYDPVMKQLAVKDYLNGLSLNEVAGKFGLRSTCQIRAWIKIYNSGGDFDHRMSGGRHMKQGRETTQEERIIIAMDCIKNNSNYGETAIKYNVSYQQVYTWVKKFLKLGKAGLEDRRGKRTADQEPRSELEELKIKMAQLEHELYITQVERDLLKKVEELERRNAFRK